MYQKIQWFLETFYADGLLKFYESCMLESIKNAVKKIVGLGILAIEKKQIKKTLL
jgi:preprotein translocase subunit Sec61beta